MSFLDNIRPYKVNDLTGFIPVLADNREIGRTTADFARVISDFGLVWRLTPAGLELSPELTDFDDRTNAVDETFVALSTAGILPVMPDYSLTGGIDWISAYFDKSFEAAFKLKRFYFPYLGIQTYSIMLNGFTQNGYWSGQRSIHINYPGMMDIIAAGMLRDGETVQDALRHEAQEEAGLTEQDLIDAKSHGYLDLLSFTKESFFKEGFIVRERFYIFDLELKDKTPVVALPQEVEKFVLLSFEDVVKKGETGNVFTPLINTVVADFLIRHGYLDSHPDFQAIKKLLYRPVA